MDPKTKKFQGDIEEEFYMKHLEGFTMKVEEELVYKLNKNL